MAGVAIQKLRKLAFDKRDYSHERTFGAPTLSLPPTLGRVLQWIKDQGFSSYCTGFATASTSEYQEGIELSPEYQTAKEGQTNGTPIYNGADPRVALKTACTYGSLPQEQSPFVFARDGWVAPANWANYPSSLDGQAVMHRKDSYYSVTKTYQGIKDALFQAQEEDGVVEVFGRWFAEWNSPVNGIVSLPTKSYITLHAYVMYDWVMCADGVERIKCQLSQGKGFGDGGILYLSPECVAATFGTNAWAGTGAYIFRDDNGQDDETIDPMALDKILGFLLNIIALLH